MRMKIVEYDEYCHTCKNFLKEENEEPCWTCLDNPVNEDSHKPTEYEPKDSKN